jgi:hypothetical protein
MVMEMVLRVDIITFEMRAKFGGGAAEGEGLQAGAQTNDRGWGILLPKIFFGQFHHLPPPPPPRLNSSQLITQNDREFYN